MAAKVLISGRRGNLRDSVLKESGEDSGRPRRNSIGTAVRFGYRAQPVSAKRQQRQPGRDAKSTQQAHEVGKLLAKLKHQRTALDQSLRKLEDLLSG